MMDKGIEYRGYTVRAERSRVGYEIVLDGDYVASANSIAAAKRIVDQDLAGDGELDERSQEPS